jgi:hypothetical protein
VRHHAGGLVDDDERVVFVDDLELDVFGPRLERDRLRDRLL